MTLERHWNQLPLKISLMIVLVLASVKGNCPDHCLCANKVIVCTCSSVTDSVVLGSFQGIDYIDNVFIHSCTRIRIPADTFAGLAIIEELGISNVKELEFEGNAFRLMTKCPDRLIIKDSSITNIPARAFSGLHNTTHVWFHKVTIGNIESNAFTDVYGVSYVYFRESTLQNVSPNAFGGMDIGHFYIRGNMVLNMVGESLFGASKINNVMIEDTIVRSMHPFALSGFRNAKEVKVLNLTAGRLEDASGGGDLIQLSSNIEKVEFKFSRFPTLVLGAYSNVQDFKIDHCDIGTVAASGVEMKSVGLLHISHTEIGEMSSGAFRGAVDIRNIVVDQCRIGLIGANTFQDAAQLERIVVLDSQLNSIEALAFAKISAGSFIFDGVRANSLPRDLFRQSNFTFMKLIGCRVDVVHSDAFSGLQADEIVVENNGINLLHPLVFRHCSANTIRVKSNWIEQLSDNAFNGASFERFELEENHLRCECEKAYADVHYLQAKASMSTDKLRVWGNRCLIKDAANSTKSTDQFFAECKRDRGSKTLLHTVDLVPDILLCQQTALLTDCYCISSSHTKLHHDVLQRLPSHTAILLLRDCELLHISVGALSGQHITQIRLAKNRELKLDANVFRGLPALKVLQIAGSAVPSLSPYAFSAADSYLRLFELIDCRIAELPTNAFAGNSMAALHINKCHIGYVRSNVTSNAKIEDISFTRSRISIIESDAFSHNQTANIKLSGNTVTDLQTKPFAALMLKTARIELYENRFACHCSMQALQELMSASLFPMTDGHSNVCYAPTIFANFSVLYAIEHAADATTVSKSTCFQKPAARSENHASSVHNSFHWFVVKQVTLFMFVFDACTFLLRLK